MATKKNEKNDEKNRIDEIIEKKNLENREIYIWGGIDDESAEKAVKKIRYLDSLEKADIRLFINSPGGVISSGLAIVDAMNSAASDVSTICMGQAASMGAVLLAVGKKGKRFIWPNARVMIHQPLISGQMFAPASDIEIQAEEMLRIRESLNKILSGATGKKLEEIEHDTDRDFFMGADESIKYGIVDKHWKD
ncbi:MAG: ClpP family protease [Fibrobacterota bacterium]